jgi:Tfp pilus assembly protein PilF
MTCRADEAIRLLEDVIRKNPNSAEAFNTLETIYAERNRKLDAKVQFQRALKINQNFVQAQNNLKKAME